MTSKKSPPKTDSTSPKPTKMYVEYDCLTFKQGKHVLVLFHATGEALWELLSINTRIEDKEEGYQRVLSTSRVQRIASFIEAGNLLPTSILVSLDHAEVTKAGKLKIEKRKDAGWVIDGQHRLAGAHRAKKSVALPVVGILNLPLLEQIRCFITVNEEAKGVPKSLYYDLLRQLPGPKSETEVTKERAVDLANILRKTDESPFYGRIVVTQGPRRGELSLNNFVRKVGPLLKRGTGRLTNFSDEDKAAVLSNLYEGLSQVFPREYGRADSIFFMTLGFGALMNALPTILDYALGNYNAFRVAEVVKLFNQIVHFDFTAWHDIGTGSAAEIQASEDLIAEIKTAFSEDAGGSPVKLR